MSDGLGEYLDDPMIWIIGLLQETADTNGVMLSKKMALEYLASNWDFISACYEEAGLDQPDYGSVSSKIAEAIGQV